MTTRVEDGKTPRFKEGGLVRDNVAIVTALSAATTNVYGAYVELSSDIGLEDIYLTDLFCQGNITTNIILEIALGGSGVEVPLKLVIAAFITGEVISQNINLNNVRVPANSRVACRIRDELGSAEEYGFNVAFNK